ncbi:hypothetical protein F5Y19DRAFT_252285 [Xylariaceae sp. FL1651]|nr:hypothetical protein F5Y19DRAFT_252285 [Xylariaceae sp. FL1651]
MDLAAQAPDQTSASAGCVDLSRSSPVPQKRPRNYGEELKGLSPLGDEDSPYEESTAAKKRQKRSHHTMGSDSDSFDDGEIVESPLLPNTIQLAENEPNSQANIQAHVLEISNAPRNVLSEDDEISGPLKALEVPEEPKENEVQAALGEVQEPEETSPVADHDLQASIPATWNRGIQLGTRTTFGAKPITPFFSASTAVLEPTEEIKEQLENQHQNNTDDQNKGTTLAQQSKKEKKRGRSRDPVLSFEASNATWNFPLQTAPEIVAPLDASERVTFWTTLVRTWIIHLVQANLEAADRLTYKVVRAGWALYLTRKMGFLQGTKKQINTARLAAQDFMSSLDKNRVDQMITDARQRHSTDYPLCDVQANDDHISISSSSLNGDDSHSEYSLAVHDDEFRLQMKYFPSAEDPSKICLSCSGIGHTTQACPELNCRFCDDRSHHSFGCPSKRRCDKCRQSGHSADACREKLVLAPEELGGCTFCGADHQDQDCSEIWRSFRPSEMNIKKVKSILAFCYICGGENHYGPECSLPDKSGKVSGRTTWSQANRNLYVDPESKDVSIAWAEIDLGQLANGGSGEFHIPGRATRKTHTYFVSSDESEEDLIHAPIKRPQSRGGIRIASNIGSTGRGANGNQRYRTSSQSRRRQDEREFSPPPLPPQDASRSWQPPLPPGPPPRLTSNRPLGSFQPAPPGTLPPRPQTFGNGRPPPGGNNGPRGRGGHRSRGRGRGRGK